MIPAGNSPESQTASVLESAVLMYYHYTYGNAGEKTQAVEVARESAEDTTVTVLCSDYTYDSLLRLTGETIRVAENVPSDRAITGGTGRTDLSGIAWDGSIANRYTYDAASNRTGKSTTVDGNVHGMEESLETGNTVYTYNGLNQLVSAANGDTTITYTYDRNGNLVSEHGGREDKTYTYDAGNRLKTV